MNTFHCWFEASLFVLAWLGMIVLFLAAVVAVTAVLTWIICKIQDGLRVVPTFGAVLGWVGKGLLMIGALSIVIGGMISARNYVCARGFKQAWHESWRPKK